MRCICPHCAEVIFQDNDADGSNYCPNCRRLFRMPPARPVPIWILGVLVVMMANWLTLCR
jgi:hypothetical protein